MDSLHAMEVEQETDTQMFVVSINKKYCFWINRENDPHWNIIKQNRIGELHGCIPINHYMFSSLWTCESNI